MKTMPPSPRSAKRFHWAIVALGTGFLVWQMAVGGTAPPWYIFVYWIVLTGVAELSPINLEGDMKLGLGFPLHMAMAVVFAERPWVAMLMCLIGSWDMREFRRQIWLDIALFNKFVLLTCTGIAALILQITNDLGTVAQVASFSLAAAIHLILNAVLVLISFHLSDRTPFRALLNMLSPGPSRLFALIYPLLGVLGGATAVIYTSAPDGKWVALVLLIPLLFARLGLVGAQEQLRLSQLVEDQQRALLDASEELFRDREAERKRIAGELHDSSLGHLAGVILTTRRVREALETAAVDVNSSLALIEDLTEQSAAGIRASLEELRQSQIERAGLIATAEKFVRDVQTVWPIKVDIQWSLEAEPPGIVALTAFQILQEAVTNAVKHAEAGRISIAVTRNNSFIELSVEDDGRGFEDPAKEPEGHYGLHLMRERVESAGGELTIVSGIDQGTQLLAKLPAGPTS